MRFCRQGPHSFPITLLIVVPILVAPKAQKCLRGLGLDWSRRADLNRGPADYEAAAREHRRPLLSTTYSGSLGQRVCWEASVLLKFPRVPLSGSLYFSQYTSACAVSGATQSKPVR